MCKFVGLICSKNVGLLSCLLSLTSCFLNKNEMGWACSTLGGGRVEVYTGPWWGNLKERDQRPKRRWEDNIKMDLQEVGW